jgi:predicted HAD superfamily phosphohydrolase
MKGKSKEKSVTLIVPILHLNGTSKQELVQLRCQAYRALDKAIEALKNMAPHGRDYYPVPGLLTKAQEQHLRRLKALADVQAELEEEVIQLDQINNGERHG